MDDEYQNLFQLCIAKPGSKLKSLDVDIINKFVYNLLKNKEFNLASRLSAHPNFNINYVFRKCLQDKLNDLADIIVDFFPIRLNVEEAFRLTILYNHLSANNKLLRFFSNVKIRSYDVYYELELIFKRYDLRQNDLRPLMDNIVKNYPEFLRLHDIEPGEIYFLFN